MFSPVAVFIVVLIYFILLFFLAQWVEGKSRLSAKVAESPLVYSLALAVYATSWTYYGSVGKAVTSGMLFTTVYIGPTLVIILWWQVMRRMVRIKNRYHIASIADFISTRYDRSASLAALATCVALIGTTPYIALQLKSVVATFPIIVSDSFESSPWAHKQIGPLAVLFMTVFTIMFGVRRLDPTERHEGMITAVAMESLIKLTAFLACGVFIVYVVHDGIFDVFHNTRAMGYDLDRFITLSGPVETPYSTWATYLVLSMSAIFFLPRQFHVAVVENSDERHITTAMWVFPLYMLLISFFVVPIAMEGLRIGFARDWADTFVLRLPLWHGRPWLALFVYVGGVSAAVSMVMISAMTLSTMLVNHIALPVIRALPFLGFLRRRLLPLKWVAVVSVIMAGYWFEAMVGDEFILVNMGMISFAAALQFAPCILGGLFWEQGNKTGALLGLGAGFILWAYTLGVPAFAQESGIIHSIVSDGPFGIALLKPTSLFGMTAMDPLGQSVFWSMLFNVGLYSIGSMLFKTTPSGMTLARDFVRVFEKRSGMAGNTDEATINLKDKTERVIKALTRYVDDPRAGSMIVASIKQAGLSGKHKVSLTELANLLGEVEKVLSGTVGAVEAHAVIMSVDVYTPEERQRLSNMYAEILADLKLSPQELKQRVDYYREREALLSRQADELELRVKERTTELRAANEELEAFSYSVSHDLRAPLRAIDGFSQAIIEDYSDKLDEDGLDYLDRVRKASQRMGELIDDILVLSRMTRLELKRETVNLSEIALEVVEELHERTPDRHVNMYIEPNLVAVGDPGLLRLMLENLLGNAWKFSRGKSDPFVSFQREGRDGMQWFVVRDNGAGFDARYKEKLFQAFSRLHTQEEFEGTGIGLAIVDRVVRKHGGKVDADGEVDKGASFFFTLGEEVRHV